MLLCINELKKINYKTRIQWIPNKNKHNVQRFLHKLMSRLPLDENLIQFTQVVVCLIDRKFTLWTHGRPFYGFPAKFAVDCRSDFRRTNFALRLEQKQLRLYNRLNLQLLEV